MSSTSDMEVDQPEEKKPPKKESKNKKNNDNKDAKTDDNNNKNNTPPSFLMELAQKIHKLQMMSGGALDEDGMKSAGLVVCLEELNEEVMKEVGGYGDGIFEKDDDEEDDEDEKEDDDVGKEEEKKKKKKVPKNVTAENPSLYRKLQNDIKSWSTHPKCLPTSQLESMEESHSERLEKLEAEVEEARENAGDMEVLDARFAVARFAAKSLSKEVAMEKYDMLLDLPKLSTGKTIDALMESARVASFYGDTNKNAEIIDRAAKLAADGGDWDRRNRLNVYKALAKLLARDVKGSAALLIDCIATFSCTELCSYKDFVVYTMITNILHLPRTELKKKIIDGPEILSVAPDIPVVSNLVNTLYECDYTGYLHAMVDLQPILHSDRFLQPHSGYILRELHVLGYKQFLDSYQSVTLESMASSFGVSTDYLDVQLSRFISAGRLTAKIDKFGGVVETNRPDKKNAQYREMIQKGDLLLNRIQKLSRVVDL